MTTMEVIEHVMGGRRYTLKEMQNINGKVRYHLGILKERGLLYTKEVVNKGMGSGIHKKYWYVNKQKLRELLGGR